VSDEKKPFNNPFGALGTMRSELPEGPTKAEAAKKKAPAKAVVRLERAGRRGKEVTIVEQLDLALEVRDEWLTALKSALGCGGVIEGTALVLQGDQRERAQKWLVKRGVRQVVVGN
jgi:translation initiation factor 1